MTTHYVSVEGGRLNMQVASAMCGRREGLEDSPLPGCLTSIEPQHHSTNPES